MISKIFMDEGILNFLSGKLLVFKKKFKTLDSFGHGPVKSNVFQSQTELNYCFAQKKVSKIFFANIFFVIY